MPVVGRLDQYASMLAVEFDETTANNPSITGLGTYYASEFSENVGIATTVISNVFPPYNLVYDEFAGVLYGPGQGTFMRQNTDKSVIVYNEIDEITDLYGRGIVRDGLVLDLDAAISDSYSGSGSTWNDLSGNNNNMTLTGSPTFSSSNGGVLQFNGSTQYGSLSGLNYSSSSFTIMASARYSGATRGRVISSVTNNWLMGHWSATTENYYAEGWISGVGVGTNDTNWRIYAAVENWAADQRSLYVNNVANITNSSAGSAGFNGLSVGRWGNGTEYSTCEVSFIYVYNRLLSPAELQQNFNATRGRFSL